MSWIYPQGIEGSNRDFSGSEQNLEEEETSKIQKREIDCLTSNNGKGVYMGGTRGAVPPPRTQSYHTFQILY